MLLFQNNMVGSGTPITTGTVPSLKGLTFAAAVQLFGDLGFLGTSSLSFFTGGVYDDVYELDTVADQSPAAGTIALIGSFIEITRSLGSNPLSGEVARMRFTPYYSRMRFKVI